MNKLKKIILDTDIGDDIDDALALLLLLKFKDKAEIIGVTTVFKNTPLRARLAKRILSFAGVNAVPVYAGYGKPYAWSPELDGKFVQYSEELENSCYKADNNDEFNGEEAVDFIIENAKKYGDELTVLAIGPYTNIAKAYTKNPAALKNCNIVLMGGCFYEQFIEYNVAMDPEACDLLFKSDLKLKMISADVTWKVQLSDEQTKKILETDSKDIKGLCARLVRMWKDNCWFNPVLHDPLAAYYVIDESICGMDEVWTEVELRGEHTRGFTANLDNFVKYLEHKTPDKKRILCSKTVDADRFIKIFLEKTFEI